MLNINKLDAGKVFVCKFAGIFTNHPFLKRWELSNKDVAAQDMAVKPFCEKFHKLGKHVLLFPFVINVYKLKFTLFRIVDKANRLVKSFDSLSGFDNIIAILNELREYTKEHFTDEEEYMESIHYEGLDAQKRAHEAFIDKLNNIDPNQLEENPQENLQELLEFLLGWLINHILHTDKKIPSVTK